MLADAERRVLGLHCHGHVVAACGDCRRDFSFIELGVDVVGRRYYFCPSCRLDLVDQLRVHILTCQGIAAALEERIERSDGLRTSSAILAAESQERARRVLERRAPASPRR